MPHLPRSGRMEAGSQVGLLFFTLCLLVIHPEDLGGLLPSGEGLLGSQPLSLLQSTCSISTFKLFILNEKVSRWLQMFLGSHTSY